MMVTNNELLIHYCLVGGLLPFYVYCYRVDISVIDLLFKSRSSLIMAMGIKTREYCLADASPFVFNDVPSTI